MCIILYPGAQFKYGNLIIRSMHRRPVATRRRHVHKNVNNALFIQYKLAYDLPAMAFRGQLDFDQILRILRISVFGIEINGDILFNILLPEVKITINCHNFFN
jgi:hypothetical protein